MSYRYRIISSEPLKLTNNGGSPTIVLDFDGATGESTDDILVGDTHTVTVAEGWGFDLSITRQADVNE